MSTRDERERATRDEILAQGAEHRAKFGTSRLVKDADCGCFAFEAVVEGRSAMRLGASAPGHIEALQEASAASHELPEEMKDSFHRRYRLSPLAFLLWLHWEFVPGGRRDPVASATELLEELANETHAQRQQRWRAHGAGAPRVVEGPS